MYIMLYMKSRNQQKTYCFFLPESTTMARGVHLVMSLIFCLLVGIQSSEHSSVQALSIIFGPNTTDLIKAGIDVPTIIRKDWAMLPMTGNCGLASKFGQKHKYNVSAVKGTLHTSFEYLTGDCTAEIHRDDNLCSTLNAAFAVCVEFPLDPRCNTKSWGYCTNFNFRVAYLWVPIEGFTNGLGPTSLSSLSNVTSERPTQTATDISKTRPLSPSATTRSDLQSKLDIQSNPEALSRIHKDYDTLNPITNCTDSRSRYKSLGFGGRLDTGCNWKFSNLFPVAYDGLQNTLVAGNFIASGDTQFAFAMQTDCNLVLYRKRFDGRYDWNALWATFTNYTDPFNHNCSLELQPTGNLVVRDTLGNHRWASNKVTTSLYSSALIVQLDGNVVVTEMISGNTIWATNTAQLF